VLTHIKIARGGEEDTRTIGRDSIPVVRNVVRHELLNLFVPRCVSRRRGQATILDGNTTGEDRDKTNGAFGPLIEFISATRVGGEREFLFEDDMAEIGRTTEKRSREVLLSGSRCWHW